MANAVEKLDDDEVQNIVTKVLIDAYNYNTELSEGRAKATEYYLGEPFGNEEEGRSQVVLTELRDAVSGMMPDIIRIFTSGQRAVEYVPGSPESVKATEYITDYITKKLEAGGFFIELHSAVMDGLVRRLGAMKWWWDETAYAKAYTLENVPQDQLESLTALDTVSLTEVSTDSATDLSTVSFTLKKKKGCFKFAAVPPEEFLTSRNARSIEESLAVAHSRTMTRGELVALGIDEDDLDEYGQPDDESQTLNNLDEIARSEVTGESVQVDVKAGKANEKILYTEAYVNVDADGDSIAERRKFLCIGSKYKIVNGKRGTPVDCAPPFAAFSPYPEPHALIGQSVADRTMDMQLYKSSIFRAMSDSLALAVFPRLLVTEGNTNIADAMNTAIGNIIRQRTVGATSSIAHDFVGREVLPILSAVDDIVERRTGQNKGAQGLDSDALQSSTASAVGAAIQKSAAHVEMICRVIAEELLKPLFRGAYAMYVEHQPEPEMARLNGQWIQMDASQWAEELEVGVNVGLGTTDTEKKIAILMAVNADQTAIYEKYGPSNPLVTLAMIRNTKAQILALHGYKDASTYYNEIPDNWQPPAPPAPQKTPEQIQVEGELQIAQLKTQREFTIKQAQMQADLDQQQWERAFEIQKHADDVVLRREAINAQFKSTTTQQQMEAESNEMQQTIDGHLAAQQQTHQQAVDAHNQQLAAQQQEHEQQLAQAQQAHEQQLAQQQATAPEGGATE